MFHRHEQKKNSQPKALKILIFTEMAEVYGYFTLQAILVLYMINALNFTDASAYAFSGQFVALAYLMPVIGGWFADRILGSRISIVSGSLILSIGYFLLMFGQSTLLFGLSLIIIGNGLFKSNISSFIGELYSPNDSRREAGFTLVYAGINIGSFLAIATVGFIQKSMGWTACFAAASIASLLCIIFFRSGYHYFNNKGHPPSYDPAKSLLSNLKNQHSLIVWFFIILFTVYSSMNTGLIGNYSVYVFGLIFSLFIAKIARKSDSRSRSKIIALTILFIIAIFYKAMFFQTYLVVNVLTDRLVDRTLWGYQIPTTLFLSLGSFFSILLGPVFARVWQSSKLSLSIPLKFALSMLVIGGCMQMLATWLALETKDMLPSISIVFFRFFFVISELMILPIGLAMVTEYAPKNCVGLMVGGWYLTAAFGGKLAGILGKFAEVPKEMITNIHFSKMIYHHAFQMYAVLNFSLFAVCLLLIPAINRLLKKESINEAPN